ncbi:MAG TPA: IPT/TIG domain-containing protein [Syntrophobacteraceae bacterium]|nr:IPT/TIG domain-containing protein [Syntrophobacteraceae bacterium]
MTYRFRPLWIRTPLWMLALLLVFPAGGKSYGAGGGILYTDFNTGTLPPALHQMNPDGTGDALVKVDLLPDPQYPIWSPDGRLIALTSSFESKGSLYYQTSNAFVFNPTTSAVQQITHWPDIYPPDCICGCTEDYTQVTSKAFSSDSGRLAVVSMRAFVWWPPGEECYEEFLQYYPVFEVYDTLGKHAKVVVGEGHMGGSFHEGDGLDWAPSEDLLICPWQVTSGSGPVAALVAVEPVEGALDAGRFRKLTTPQFLTYQGNYGIGVCYDQDFHPAVGPLSNRVAYVRETDCIDGGYPVSPSTISVRMVDLDGTDDGAIYAVPSGKYVTHLSWAPDESKLVLSFGTQVVTNGWPLSGAIKDTIHIAVLNSDGAGFRRISGPADDHPAWNPRGLEILPAPVIVGINPTAVKSGGKGFNLTVNGQGFNGLPATAKTGQARAAGGLSQASEVLWNGSALPTTFVSPTRLVAAVPASDIKTPGRVKISVLNPAPGGGISAALTLTVRSPWEPGKK